MGPCPERLVLRSDSVSLVVMNLYPYNNAHLLVAPRRHVATLALATEEERLAIINQAALATTILDQVLSPHGYNLGVNQGQVAGAGLADHLHLHVTPRYMGDVNYMTALSETRVIPEHVRATYDRLVGYFN
jgi:ATP adenylyltransferase